MSVAKLVLGTAGLGGQPYGLEKRVVSKEDALKLIEHAHESGIRRFDTAPAYGDAESRLGIALKDCDAIIYTKSSDDRDAAITSHERLGKVGQTFFLWHNYTGGPLPMWCSGATIYAADFKYNAHGPGSNFSSLNGEMVQCDWNLLQQFIPVEKAQAFMARSVFLRGYLTDEATEPPTQELKYALDRCRRVAALLGVSLKHMALRAALQNPAINFVVIGPTSLDELDECIDIAESKPMHMVNMHLLWEGRHLVDPRTWPK